MFANLVRSYSRSARLWMGWTFVMGAACALAVGGTLYTAVNGMNPVAWVLQSVAYAALAVTGVFNRRAAMSWAEFYKRMQGIRELLDVDELGADTEDDMA